MIGFLYLLGYIMAWPIQLIFFKTRIYYEDKKDTSKYIKGKALVISNHKSLKDFMMTMFLFPFRKVHCLMSELIFTRGKFIGTLTKIMGGIRVDRNSYDFGFIDTSVELLDRNKMLLIYPEARIPTTKKMLAFHPSYILIALKTKCPIVPIYTDGVYKLFKRTRVVIGKKINLSEYCNNDNPTKEEIDYLNKLVRNKILELEKICKAEKNKDKYPKGLNIKCLFKDLGRSLIIWFRLYFRIKVHNSGNKKEKLKIKGNGIIVANHQSFKDPVIMMSAFWRRRVFVLAGEAVFDGHPVRGFLLKNCGIIRINRNIQDFEAFSKCIDILNAGHVLVMFPGGGIDKDDTKAYKSGAALLAYQTGAPLYPVYMKHTKRFFGRHHVYLGEKIDVNPNNIKFSDLDNISENIHNQIKKLEGEANGNI